MADNPLVSERSSSNKNVCKKNYRKYFASFKEPPEGISMGHLKIKTQTSLAPKKRTQSDLYSTASSFHFSQGPQKIPSLKTHFQSFVEVKKKNSESIVLPYLSKGNFRKKMQNKTYLKVSQSPLKLDRNLTVKKDNLEANAKSFIKKDPSTPDLAKKRGPHKVFLETEPNENDPLIASSKAEYPGYKKAIFSEHSSGIVKTFGVNSYKGIVRNYNEDRVTILLNISKPHDFQGEWPKNLSIFGLYDGHSGNKCANFLRDKAHSYIFNSTYFPTNIEAAIEDGFERLEKDFFEKYVTGPEVQVPDKSGSCALIALIINKTVYIINVGDSRAIMSARDGKRIIQLSNDHKPNQEDEKQRIFENQGFVYQVNIYSDIYRIVPGNLSVSRSVGDATSKLPNFGGKEGVVISKPEITRIDIEESEDDFILLGSDGIFDKLTNKEIVQRIFSTLEHKAVIGSSAHSQAGVCADMTIKFAMEKRSKDNLTAIFIGFQRYLERYKKKKETSREKLFHIKLHGMEKSECGRVSKTLNGKEESKKTEESYSNVDSSDIDED